MRNAYNILVGKPEGNRPLGRPRHKWERREDDIIMDVREIKLEGVDWIHVSQDRDQRRAVVNILMNLKFVDWLSDN